MTVVSDVKKLASSIDLKSLKKGRGSPMKILVLGAGVIGGSVGGWIAAQYDDIYFLDQGAVAEALRNKGITLYEQGHEDEKTTVGVKVVDSLDMISDADVVIIAVKNYSLDAVAAMVKEKMGDRPVIVAMQNGLVNQDILPKYFSKVIYCVVSFNAWMDEPGLIGYQKKGPLHLGTIDNSLQKEMKAVSEVFNLGVETEITGRLRDAAHCKLVINLTNSLTTLIGLGIKDILDRGLFQKLLTNLTWEGVSIVKADGVKESKLGGMPPWIVMWAGAKLPHLITRPLFEKNVRKMVISSMAQDVLQRRGADSELETINGYILAIADKHNMKTPYNRAVYELCKQKFAEPDFEPMAIEDVWEFVSKRL